MSTYTTVLITSVRRLCVVEIQRWRRRGRWMAKSYEGWTAGMLSTNAATTMRYMHMVLNTGPIISPELIERGLMPWEPIQRPAQQPCSRLATGSREGGDIRADGIFRKKGGSDTSIPSKSDNRPEHFLPHSTYPSAYPLHRGWWARHVMSTRSHRLA